MRTDLKDYLPLPLESAAPTPKPFPLWSFKDFEAYKPPEDYDILGSGLLCRRELAVLVGIGGVGKSRLVMALAIAQIVGRTQFLGFALHVPPLRWLVVGSENSAVRWKTDFGKLTANLDDAQRAAVQNQLLVAATFEDEDPTLTLDVASGRIEETIKAARPDVVVFDPWADLCPGDENTTPDCRAGIVLLRRCVRRTAPNAATLLIAHARPGKTAISEGTDAYSGGAYLRGNKALANSARSMFALVPGDAEDFNRLVLVCIKANNAPRFAPRGVRFDPNSFEYTEDPTFDIAGWRDDVDGIRGRKLVTLRDVCAAVRSGNRTTESIVGALSDVASERTIKGRLQEALRKGYLTRVAKGLYALGNKFDNGQDPLP
ncbi:MAG: AAA family ATPase [Verrucomicrobiales bacterium]|nr:AAA family ATPase [Verrucomicrobiales bacterium]